jgi:uncharacterized membrane protein
MFRNLKRMGRWTTIAVAIGLVCSSEPLAGKPPSPPGGGGGDEGYTILHLDPNLSANVTWIRPFDVNDHNDVVGFAEDDQGDQIALFWTVTDGQVTAFHLPGGSFAGGVNNHGESVGIRPIDPVSGYTSMGVYWANPLADPEDLPPLPGHFYSAAGNINDDGFVVGQSRELVPGVDKDGEPILVSLTHAVAWRISYRDGQFVVWGPLELGSLDPTRHSLAVDVGDAQEVDDEDGNPMLMARVTGSSRNLDGQPRAVIWEIVGVVDEQGVPGLALRSGPTDLGTLLGSPQSWGERINRHGDVCGNGETGGFLKRFGQPMEPLPGPPKIKEEGYATAWDINAAAEVVGTYRYGHGYDLSILWRSDGTTVDLEQYTSGTEWATLGDPTAISDTGAIVGQGKRNIGTRKQPQYVQGTYIMIPN